MEDRRAAYPENQFARMMNLFDSHDTDRFASMIVNRDRTYYAGGETFAYDASIWAGSTDKQSFLDLYRASMDAPGNFSIPRRTRLGVRFNF